MDFLSEDTDKHSEFFFAKIGNSGKSREKSRIAKKKFATQLKNYVGSVFLCDLHPVRRRCGLHIWRHCRLVAFLRSSSYGCRRSGFGVISPVSVLGSFDCRSLLLLLCCRCAVPTPLQQFWTITIIMVAINSAIVGTMVSTEIVRGITAGVRQPSAAARYFSKPQKPREERTMKTYVSLVDSLEVSLPADWVS